jgi:hypothetical protein
MDSDELRKMSLNNAKLAMNQMNGGNRRFMQGLIPNPCMEILILTDRQKESIKKMMIFFTSDEWRHWMFKVHIGKVGNGTPKWMGMLGFDVFRHLEEVFIRGSYKDDEREILNGIRKCYVERLSQ